MEENKKETKLVEKMRVCYMYLKQGKGWKTKTVIVDLDEVDALEEKYRVLWTKPTKVNEEVKQ